MGCGGSAAPVAQYLLKGAVTGKGQSLAGARVRVQGASDVDRPSFVVTDGSGGFTLTIAGRKAGDRVVVTAGAPGWKSAAAVTELPANGMAPAVDLPPVPVDDPSYPFQDLATGDPPCNFCHFDQSDKWADSQHARAAKDPLMLDEHRVFVAWWQQLDPYRTDEATAFAGPFLAPDRKGDIGRAFDDGGARYRVVADNLSLGDCAKCHTPIYAAGGGQDLRPSVLAGKAKVLSEGVACDFCHKVSAVKTASEHDLTLAGIAKATLDRPGAGDQVMFGPYDDITYVKMQSSYLPLVATSEFCADCHSDAKVIELQPVDGSGQPAGAIVERLIWGEDTYREWRFAADTVLGVHPSGVSSASGQGPFTTADNYAGRPLQCQDCHMLDPPPDPKTGEKIADWSDPQFNDVRIANNAEAVMRDPRTVRPHRFKGRTARFIAWATELQATARRDGSEIVVDVGVENRHTGHRFPSGLPDRNAILLVDASDGSGPLAQTGGPKVPPWGSGDGVSDPPRDVAGRAGRGYARQLASADGEAPVFYLRAVRDAAPDTRLKAGEQDTSSYRFAAGSGPIVVHARIIHRLRFKAQSDRFVAGHPGTAPASFETPGDDLTVMVP